MGIPRFKVPNRTNSSRRTSPIEQLPAKRPRLNESSLPSPASEQLKAPPIDNTLSSAEVLHPSLRASPETQIETETPAYLPWALKHEPKTLDEVAIHPSKRSEIYNALDPRLGTRVLIVSGPAGSSKSTCIKLSAEARGQSVIEFQAPESSVGSTTFVNSFREFLIGCAMYERSRYIVLVEELPALFHEDTRQAFEEALLSWADEPNQPIVAVAMTEIEVSARYSEAIVVPRVLGQLVSLGAPEVVWLKTNAINLTIMQRHLKAVTQRENHPSVPAPVIKSLAQCGDIRSAVNALEFLCLRGMPKTVSPENLWTRGSAVELFYVIGKIVWTSSKKGSLEESLGMFEDSMDSLHLTVLENYTSAKHQRLPVSAAAETTEWLSIADLFSGDTSIGALGAANAIAEAGEDTHLPKKFVQTRFTQFPKWQSEKHSEESKLLRLLKNARQSGSLINRAVVLDTRAFDSKLSVRNNVYPLADSDDDDDDF